ncbi:MAG: nascent polypeptide-associated complex protein [Methanotrichaceae archaeon]
MFPGLPGAGGRGMSPKKMKGMLKNMGIDIDELEGVKEVVIRMADKEIVIENATVAVMDAHGIRSYQISGDSSERPVSVPGAETGKEPEVIIPDSDVDLVVAQTGASENEAKAALIESRGDIAAAIMKLGTQ